MSISTHRLFRLAAPLLLSASFNAAWAAATLKVEEAVTVAAPPAVVWKVIGDFASLHQWHPVVASSEITRGKDNVRGAVRKLTTKDGARIVEELLAYDGKGHSMRYRFLESPMPVTDYVSTLAVKPDGKGSRIVWTGEFKRTEQIDDAKAKDIFVGIYRAGFAGVRAKLGETATN
ncbi:MAG: SRPBCC family protein [Pollutimonas bauzanensis]